MTSTAIKTEFGYYPAELSLRVGAVQITTLPSLQQTVADLSQYEGIEGDWIYAPAQQVRNFGSGIVTKLYAARVFGLPKTHLMVHASADGEDQLAFHVWALSFFTGMRLTTTEAGFLDATPLRPGKLVDFTLGGRGLTAAVELAESFWVSNRHEPDRAKRFAAAVHALFIGQNPRHLQFEHFIFLYTALDACFALAASLYPPTNRPNHSGRIGWMCDLFGMATPQWATRSTSGGAEIAGIRNATLHEALFMGQPLGFALHGGGTNQNLPLEIEALICRLLVALLGAPSADYVQSPIHTRQRHALNL